MTILHIIESGGGSATFVLYLIKHLPLHNHIVVYGERSFDKYLHETKKTFENAKFFKWKHIQREIYLKQDLKAYYYIMSLLKKLSYDIVHLHSSKAGFLGRIACYQIGFKNVIYTPNGLSFVRTDISFIKKMFFTFLEKIADRLNGRAVACSESEASEMKKYGINASFVSNGTTITSLHNHIKIQSDKKFVIATIGRITTQKNPYLFNQIAEEFEKFPNVEFIWIGSGELYYLLKANNIKITGWVESQEVYSHLYNIDLYISTALWEGLPFAVLEAMNLEKPLLLYNCIGNIDLVEEGSNGFLFRKKEEAIKKIWFFIENPQEIVNFAIESRRLCESKFDVRLMSRRYEEEYFKNIS